MNRLIIIGNGFDLAHGLKTKYSDFINHYWRNKDHFSDDLVMIPHHVNCNFSESQDYKGFKDVLKSEYGPIEYNPSSYHYREIVTSKVVFEFTNQFFGFINERYDQPDWVDIEMEYYRTIKKILSEPYSPIYGTVEKFEDRQLSLVTKLNLDIAAIKIRFNDYLVKIVIPEISNSYDPKKHALFENQKLTRARAVTFLQEFSEKIRYEQLSKWSGKADFVEYPKFDNTCILNFNYTHTAGMYNSKSENSIINIHGEVNNDQNPINLGFGDEMDKFYSQIEDLNKNEYLRFMKSAHYLKGSNYRKLFDFIEAGYFQVHVLGHSCGLSDRTLLKSIFENKFCISIKVFYYQFDKPNEYSETNNYSDVVKNISRHFSDKVKMREKIVEENLCNPLPQNPITT